MDPEEDEKTLRLLGRDEKLPSRNQHTVFYDEADEQGTTAMNVVMLLLNDEFMLTSGV